MSLPKETNSNTESPESPHKLHSIPTLHLENVSSDEKTGDENDSPITSPPPLIETTIPQTNMQKLCFCLVGLPCRGKSQLSKMIRKYLNWMGVKSRIFNSGKYRRIILGKGQTADFFDVKNKKALRQREMMINYSIHDMLQWFKHKNGQVGILDATNTTRKRRKMISDMVLNDEEVRVYKDNLIFIESICNLEDIVLDNVRKYKINGEDYKNYSKEDAFNDFVKRMRLYEKVYEPLDDEYDANCSWIKLIDVGKRVILNQIRGYIPLQVLPLIMSLNLVPKRLFVTRHGESIFNISNRIGGDSDLSEQGYMYSKVLSEFIEQQQLNKLVVWTSTMKRTIQTSQYINAVQVRMSALNEIKAGMFDSMTYEEIQEKYPEEYQKRQKDKYHYRYPVGESYRDLVNRVGPVILEMERTETDLLIVCHQAIMRVLMAYLSGQSPHSSIDIDTPHHQVMEIAWAGSTQIIIHDLQGRLDERMKGKTEM